MERELPIEEVSAGTARPVATHEVRGAGGLRLHAREWGNPDGPPLLLIHGISQCDLCWSKQVSGDLARRFRIVTYDIRGHGLSEKPSGPEHYADGRLWAEDVAAVIEQTGLERPVLVGWSYGGYIVTDFLRAYGDEGIGAIDLVGAAMTFGGEGPDHLGPGLLENVQDMCAPDLAANIAATRRFLRAMTARELDEDARIAALCWSMVTPADVRGALIAREKLACEEVLADVSVPVLVTHGREDAIILPSMSERTVDICRAAVPSWYDGVGHMPFWEDPERFDRELAELADRVADGGHGAAEIS